MNQSTSGISPGRLVASVLTGPVRWFQTTTWRATVQLAVWFVMSCLFALVGLVALIVSWVAGRAGSQGTQTRSSALHLSAETVGLHLQRIETFSGVRIQPLALGRAGSGASWRERRRALEPAPTPWRLPAYELASFGVAAALTAVSVEWWRLTVARFLVSAHTASFITSSVDVFGVHLGPSKFLSLHVIAELVLGIIGVVLWPTLVRAVPAADLGLARALLGPGTSELSAEVDRLAESRAQAVAAADTERRRIERDLHDGFQPQLVNLALNLGLARSRLASDPEGARTLLDRAHEDAKRATEDLRNLVRGIHPSVLDERGLDAAFSALAAGSAVPVQIDVHLDRRPPREAEGIAYFVVAESITNVNKHAHAERATITVTEIDGALRVLVQDDGRGGARHEPNGGLAGLDARIAGVDGTFSVTSPVGGPTWIEARIPCGS